MYKLRIVVLLIPAFVALALSVRCVADETPPRTLVICYAPALETVAEQWAAYRADHGWSVVLHRVENNGPIAGQRHRLRESLRAIYAERAPQNPHEFAVLMLGDAPSERDVDSQKSDDALIATWHFDQHDPDLRNFNDPRYATDEPYQRMNDDLAPDILLGRVPARTAAEAQTVLDKIKRYEQHAPLGVWRMRAGYTAGEGHFGQIDRLLEWMFKMMIDRFVPDDISLSMIYANADSIYCPPPHRLPEHVLDQMSDGALLWTYVGHGRASAFDTMTWNGRHYPILNVDDINSLTGDGSRLPIALLVCCDAGWFDLPESRRSLAEAMLLHPAGPVAVIAGSRQTHPYANAIIQKDFADLLLTDRAATIGGLDFDAARSLVEIDAADRQIDAIAWPISLATNWNSTFSRLRSMHTRLYNLLGDPTARVAEPPGQFDSLTIQNDALIGLAPNINSGTATIRVESRRTNPARSHELRPVDAGFDTDFAQKAAHNFPIANDTVLIQRTEPIRDGRLQIPLDLSLLPPSAYLIRVYAIGVDANENPVDALGVVRLPLRPDSVSTKEQPAALSDDR